MKLTVIDAATNEELVGPFFMEDGKLWECDFSSCDRLPNPTKQWNGYAYLVEKDVIIKFEEK